MPTPSPEAPFLSQTSTHQPSTHLAPQNASAASRPDRIRILRQLAFTPWTSHRPSSESMNRTAVVPRVVSVCKSSRRHGTGSSVAPPWSELQPWPMESFRLPTRGTDLLPTIDSPPPAWMLAWLGLAERHEVSRWDGDFQGFPGGWGGEEKLVHRRAD